MIDDIRVAMIAAILLFSGLAGMTATYGAAATEESSVEASVEVVHEQPIDLVGTDVHNESVTLNGTALERGEDYALDERRGHIYFLSAGATEEGDSVSLSYDAEVPERLAERIRGPMGDATVIAGTGVIILFAIVVLSALATMRGRW